MSNIDLTRFLRCTLVRVLSLSKWCRAASSPSNSGSTLSLHSTIDYTFNNRWHCTSGWVDTPGTWQQTHMQINALRTLSARIAMSPNRWEMLLQGQSACTCNSMAAVPLPAVNKAPVCIPWLVQLLQPILEHDSMYTRKTPD